MAKFSDVAPAPAPREWTGLYLDGKDKAHAVGEVFTIVNLMHNPAATFGPRWEVGVLWHVDGREYTITLATNPGRDAQFRALAAALAEGQSIDPVVFAVVGENKKGNPPYGFVDATAEQIATATQRHLLYEAAMIGRDTPPDLTPRDDAGVEAAFAGLDF